MSTFQIKLIAIVTMVIDHIGLYFFPDIVVLRIIGRLSFPLFAWLIANGASHTKNIHGYILRLFVFSLISQIPYVFLNRLYDPEFMGLNIFFTLTLGLGAIYFIKQSKNKIIWLSVAMVTALIGHLINTSYGAAGVLCVIFFYVYYNHLIKMVISQTLLFTYFYTVPVLLGLIASQKSSVSINVVALLQPVSALSLIFISQYSGKQGLKWQYFFYVFYPLHLGLFYVIKIFL